MYNIMAHQNTTRRYVGTSLLTALAIAIATLKIHIPYPILPYLKFDLTEIPIFIVLVFYGLKLSTISSIVYWVILLGIGEFTPIGPTMKFLAILSMLVGYTIGYRITKSNITGLVCSIIVRVMVMSLMNYIVLELLIPGGLDWAASFVSRILGVKMTGYYEKFITLLVFTAIFNTIHTVIVVLPSNYIVLLLVRRLRLIVS